MRDRRAGSVGGLLIALLGCEGAGAATFCEQRTMARQLRDDYRSGDALVVLDAAAPLAVDASDVIAWHLDRAEVLLDLWRTAPAVSETAKASALLADTQVAPAGSCDDPPSESPIRARELTARATRIQGNYAKAAAEWAAALALRRDQRPPNPAALVRAMSLAGDTFSLAGQDDEVDRLSAEALRIAESLEPPDEALLARAVEGVGMQASAHGDYERAEALYQRALDLYRQAKGETHPIQASLWLTIGSLAEDRVDLLSADAAYQQAAAILEPLADDSLASDKATLALNQGSMDTRLGRIDDALAKLEIARDIWTRTRGPDHPHLAWVNEAVSDLQADAGRLPEADTALAQALVLRERSMPGSPTAVRTAARLAALRARQGRAAESRALWRDIEIQAARLTTASSFLLANLAGRRAETSEFLGDLASAARLRAEAEALLRKQLPSGHPALAEARGQRARLAWLRGQRGQARRLATEAWQAQRRVVADTLPTMPESDALRYVERTRALRDLMLCSAAYGPPGSASPAAVDEVMRELAASRALIASALYARDRVAPAGATSADHAADALAQARRRYASLLWQPVSAAADDYADELAKARNELQEAERKAVRRGAAPGPRVAADADAWSALVPGDALVAFGRYRCPEAAAPRKADGAGYVAFVRTAGHPARVVRFSDGAALERAVVEWHDAVAGAVYASPTEAQDEEVDARGRALAKVVWAPLAAVIGSAARVFIVPDGALHSLSWSALPGSGRPYLVDEPRLLHVLTAESDLRAPQTRELRSDPRAVVVLADPQVGRTGVVVADASLGPASRPLRSSCSFVDPLRLPRLDQAVDEARDVEARANAAGRPVEVATGASASETWLRDHAPRAGILHLAAHGSLLSPESCRDVSDAASEPAAVRVRTLWEEAVRARPLMRSGLLLTGAAGFTPLDAPGSEDDGILVAEEASRLDLRGTDWVVLSACSTRRGPVVDAEGALGLHRAFHSAGARTVIASLWDVQDAPARRFMSALYDARLRGKRSTAEAMRDAQRAVLSELRASGRSTHPVQWAAFVASGDWR